STPPMRNVYIPPPYRVEPKRHWSSVGRHLWCAGREAGVGAMQAKRPSFGCLIL
ncbi:hypothetical protein C8J57DRAFT_971156, partial [Mycena rebaudengoi]